MTTPPITIGDAIDWANLHRNVIARWVAQEVTKNRMEKVDGAAHVTRAAEVYSIVMQLWRSVDAMTGGRGFPPIKIRPATVKGAALWLAEHVRRVERWAGIAAEKHRTQDLLMKSYRGRRSDVDDGTDDTWQNERPEYDPMADVVEAGDKIVHRRWGLSREQAEHEVRCSRLALAMVESVSEASEAWVHSGTYPIPSIVQQAVP